MVTGHLFEWLDAADKTATVALNFDGGSGADLFFHTVSSTLSWIPLGAAFLWLVYRECRGDWAKMLAIVVGLAVTVTLCDRISAGIIKPLFMRLRPSHDSEVCWLLHYVGNHRGGLYGFVSSHAANAFGAVAYARLFVRKRGFVVPAFCFAATVGYSRIYLGLHYLGDVAAGAMLGVAIGTAVGTLALRFEPLVASALLRMRGRVASLLLLAMIAQPGKAQTADTTLHAGKGEPRGIGVTIDRLSSSRLYNMTYAAVPLIVGGLVVKGEDLHFRRLRNDYLPYFHRNVDDYMQFGPAAVMLGLKAAGVKSRSSWGRMLASDAFSAVLMAGVVNTLKRTTNVTRPDGTDRHSFPSGHTATAFMTATMLAKEYGGRSPWISIGAYSMASATGLMRMANNKHWLSDVMTGAGIGILSTELGYCFADILLKDRGILRRDSVAGLGKSDSPSFVSLYLGMNIPISHYDIDEGRTFRTSSGSSVGVEGAWFLSRCVGIGGRFTVANTSIITGGSTAEDNTFDAVAAAAGGYFSLPVSTRWLVGTKLLGEYVHYPKLKLADAGTVASRSGIGFGSGLSLTFREARHYGLRFFLDYNLLPSHSRGSNEWMNTLTLGSAFTIQL